VVFDGGLAMVDFVHPTSWLEQDGESQFQLHENVEPRRREEHEGCHDEGQSTDSF
jgi:hypothetical protein